MDRRDATAAPGTVDASRRIMRAAQYHVEPTAESHFSWLRTRMSIDRTFMSWVRTAASMIGFGFTIVQFFEHLAKMDEFEAPRLPHAPLVLGLALIGTGVVGLAIALYEHTVAVHHLDEPQFRDIADERLHKGGAIVVAIAMMVTGIVAFTSILMRALF
jgi:putative membrane protein